ncbi:MAG TPA: FliM/FliN family flagellar motor switch protein [Alphaproteobacteria bacterium]|jgi:flagellar motor switch protein FliN/FliY|nr:FliM/FliN family flagellar motor switch protein [Alphaproteobacteria bacterium]MDP6269654.1 FliM/FliN family flagellar motor switch protein [Alphaproteobacteria bacterium]MDP7427304.1 FliM/FliN family flagellar motor switch protein [Alphaproteobacteria bacterium]HJM50467.1 FliM/FliN family flagellar motor switch protein [Alphaproteobacteria bacterium]|tara:strand:- start:83 stop:337 length:255 start_codon:yes stop_codon:yes gene_type:complete
MADDSSEKAVSDVTVELSVVLGRAEMPIHQLLKMGRGAVIELDATVDSDVGIFANNRLIARGDVMVAGENIAVSITENIVASEE